MPGHWVSLLAIWIAHGGEIDMKKKSVAFKAQDSKNEEESGCQEEESDEEMALFVKRFNRMMSKKRFGKRGQSQVRRKTLGA